MKKSTTFRWIFYAGGLLILAMGIILNTKSGLGVSPIISVAYSISTIWNLNFGNTTFGLYTVFVIIELLLHTCHNYRQRREENHALDASTKKSLPLILGMDLLQLPLSLVFTRFMNLFSSWIPAPEQVGMRFVVLLCGIILTGIGAAMSLNMRIVPNPGDGIVQAIADTIRKPVGFTKNCFDLCNICITITVSRSGETAVRCAGRQYLYHDHGEPRVCSQTDRRGNRNGGCGSWCGTCDRAV